MNPESGSLFIQYAFPLVMVAAIFYFIVLIPSKRQQRKVREFLENLKENDRIVTTSGIYGQIARINGDRVQLQVAEKVRIEVAKAAIGGYQGQPPVVETNP
jgi:preprotein translocase subunit YajC